jgi:hypothetical protein
MMVWEKNKQAKANLTKSGQTVGRQFTSTNKSKKALKKEEKKKKIAEEQNDMEAPEEEDNSVATAQNSVAAARERLRQKTLTRGKKKDTKAT